MAKPYSYDLRKKVIDAIALDGVKKSEASQLFNISRNTIDLWFKRLEETGDFQVPYRINRLVIITKFSIGQNFKSLLAPMETRPKKKWLNYGQKKLAIALYQDP